MPPSKNFQELTSLHTVEQSTNLIIHLIYLPKLIFLFCFNGFASYPLLPPGPIRNKNRTNLISNVCEIRIGHRIGFGGCNKHTAVKDVRLPIAFLTST